MRSARWGSAVALAAVTPFALTALAEPARAPVDLEWKIPAGGECPDAAYVRGEVSRLLGEAPVPEEKRVRARAEVWRGEDATWHLKLAVSGAATGERSVDAGTCRAIADATALVLALAIDPERVATRSGAVAPPSAASSAPSSQPTPSASAPPPAPAPSPSPPPASAAPAPTRAPAPVRPPPGPPRTPPFFVRAEGAMDLGTLPVLAPGVGGAIGWRPGRLGLSLSGAYFPAVHKLSPGSRTAGGAFDLAAFGARACFAFPIDASPVELAPCAGLDVDRVSGAAYGVRFPSSGDAVWPAIAAGGELGLHLSELLALRLGLEAAVPFSQPSFVIDAVGVIHQPFVVAGRVKLGVEIRF